MSQTKFVSFTLERASAVRDLARKARSLDIALGCESPKCLQAYAKELDAYAALLEAEAAKIESMVC
jgi:hypothetical protein